MQSLPNGSMLGGYQILERVGKGGMGEVYRARQVSMDRVVALKVLSAALAAKDPGFAERFVAEARAAGRLNHPNLVGVHDVGSAPAPEGVDASGELQYFSMEFVEGETVKDLLEREGHLEPPLIARIMLGMAEALIYAHGQGLIHRDIKPDNIMVTAQGAVKLADLGLATDPESTAIGDGKVMGTPLYMSPEQARAQALDGRSDIYSLGATLYHCLTGRTPYSGESARAIMRAHVHESVPDPADVRPEIPDGWRRLCIRMMAKDPADRPAGASELRDMIRQVIAGRLAKGSTTRVLTPAPGRGARTGLIIGGVAAGLAVAAGAGWWLAGRQGASPPPIPVDQGGSAVRSLPQPATAQVPMAIRPSLDAELAKLPDGAARGDPHPARASRLGRGRPHPPSRCCPLAGGRHRRARPPGRAGSAGEGRRRGDRRSPPAAPRG